MVALRTYVALAGLVGGGYLLIGGGDSAVSASAPKVERITRTATIPATGYVAPRVLPALPPITDEVIEDEIVEEEIRGYTPSGDVGELAFVFSVDGVSYVRLSSDERASSHGRQRLIETDGMHAVVAPVTTAAMPAALQKWSGKSVIVDGHCRAKVTGFAEVSRVTGDASDPYDYDPDDGERPDTSWTIEDVVDTGVVLAARLDGCDGTWARSAELGEATVVARVDAPALERAAREELLARTDDDPTQESWAEQGGEGNWRDAAEVITYAVHNPDTDEHWVFVQARRHGGCGDPGFAMMAAYRANADGTVRRAATLEYGYQDIHDVVDVDGDGQPELLLGGGDAIGLADLANNHHDSIYVPERHYGCGC